MNQIRICGCDQSKDLESQLDGFMKLNFDLSEQLQTANLNWDSLLEDQKKLLTENIALRGQNNKLLIRTGGVT